MATPLLRAELLLFAGTALTGAVFAALYLVLCGLRGILSCGKGLTIFTDILFFVAAALAAYGVIFRLGDGVVRYYAACGLTFGALLVREIIRSVENTLQKWRYHRKIKRTEETSEK